MATPFPKLKRFAASLGWTPLRRFRHVEPGWTTVTWYVSGMREGGRLDCFLQINEYPIGQQQTFAAAVYAPRFRLCSGWHTFTLPHDQPELAAATLAPWLSQSHFSTTAARRAYRLAHPETAGYSWRKIYLDGPPLMPCGCQNLASQALKHGPNQHIKIFAKSERKAAGAYFWDSLRDEIPAWKDMKYVWIARSVFGDQIILTYNSPIHHGPAVYMHGPDVAGPRSDDPNWIDNILYLGPSDKEWLARVERFGDEFSVVPGGIDELLENPDEYRKIYRELNPGLTW